MKRKIAVLTGAGMSAESGLKTFRDAGGLWEGHSVMEVATPEGFANNPHLVLDFYNQRRRQLLRAEPNAAHLALAGLEDYFDVTVITQNVDDLHERAGSSCVIHLHGELFKVRSMGNETLVLDWRTDLCWGDTCEGGHQLRPHIVWFGEEVPLLGQASEIICSSDIVLIIGTSMQVYPAAGLVHYCAPDTPVYFIDPNPTVSASDFDHLTVIPEKAVQGVPKVVELLLASLRI